MDTAFNIGDTVEITSVLEPTPGYVHGIYIDANGASFHVQYQDKVGVVQREYFIGDELRKV